MDDMKRTRLNEQWHRRDLPVLVHIAEQIDAGDRRVRAKHVATQMKWSFDDVVNAMQALCPTYLEGKPLDSFQGRIDFGASALTDSGRRAAGLWPDGEGVDALVSALRQAEAATDDPEEKTLVGRAAGAVGMVSRDIMIDVVAAVVARQSGIG